MMRTTVPFFTSTWLGGGETLPSLIVTLTSRGRSCPAAGLPDGVGETVTGAEGVAKVGVLEGAVADGLSSGSVALGEGDEGSDGMAAVGDAGASTAGSASGRSSSDPPPHAATARAVATRAADSRARWRTEDLLRSARAGPGYG